MVDRWSEQPTVNIRVVDSITPRGYHARVTGPNSMVLLRSHEHDEVLVAHELCHIKQWQRIGWDFPLVYAAQIAQYRYADAPLEVECYRKQWDPWYRAWAAELLEALHATPDRAHATSHIDLRDYPLVVDTEHQHHHQ